MATLRRRLLEAIGRQPKVSGTGGSAPVRTSRALDEVLVAAGREAERYSRHTGRGPGQSESHLHPVYGARPLRRFISHEVETSIGRALLTGDIHDGAVITLGTDDDRLVTHVDNPEPADPMAQAVGV